MTLENIKKLIEFVANKNQKGGAYNPDDFNVSLEKVNIDLYNEFVGPWQVGTMIPIELRTFKIPISSGSISGGSYSLPSNFSNLATYKFSCTIDGLLRYGHFVSEDQAKRLRTYPPSDLTKNPIAVIRSSSIAIWPTNASNFMFEYLRTPTTPFYDYYIDANLNLVYLAEGSSHTLGAGEVGSAGQTSGNVSSLTSEIEWDDDVHPKFISRLALSLGVNLREADVVGYSNQLKAENK